MWCCMTRWSVVIQLQHGRRGVIRKTRRDTTCRGVTVTMLQARFITQVVTRLSSCITPLLFYFFPFSENNINSKRVLRSCPRSTYPQACQRYPRLATGSLASRPSEFSSPDHKCQSRELMFRWGDVELWMLSSECWASYTHNCTTTATVQPAERLKLLRE